MAELTNEERLDARSLADHTIITTLLLKLVASGVMSKDEILNVLEVSLANLEAVQVRVLNDPACGESRKIVENMMKNYDDVPPSAPIK